MIEEDIEDAADLAIEHSKLEDDYMAIHSKKVKANESYRLVSTKIDHLKSRSYELPEKPVVLDDQGEEYSLYAFMRIVHCLS
jgi:hypothetical protein